MSLSTSDFRRRWIPPAKLQARRSTMAGERVEETRAVNARSRAQSQRGNLRCSSSRPPIPPRPAFHSRIRSTSLNVISSFVRSYSFVVRGDSCPAVCWACEPSVVLQVNHDAGRPPRVTSELAEKIKKNQFNLRLLTEKIVTAREFWSAVLAA